MADIQFDPSLVLILDQASTSEEVESSLARALQEHGHVRKTFEEAILTREQRFPTALRTGSYNAAIPHCSPEHVMQAAVGVAVTPQGVPWHIMDDPKAVCDVHLTIMLALTSPDGHLQMLKKVVAVATDQELMANVVSTSSQETVFSLVAPRLLTD